MKKLLLVEVPDFAPKDYDLVEYLKRVSLFTDVKEIAIPTEEEIANKAYEKSSVFDNHFISGANWMLKQLTNEK
jgi:hypothetical protein